MPLPFLIQGTRRDVLTSLEDIGNARAERTRGCRQWGADHHLCVGWSVLVPPHKKANFRDDTDGSEFAWKSIPNFCASRPTRSCVRVACENALFGYNHHRALHRWRALGPRHGQRHYSESATTPRTVARWWDSMCRRRRESGDATTHEKCRVCANAMCYFRSSRYVRWRSTYRPATSMCRLEKRKHEIWDDNVVHKYITSYVKLFRS
jgi:hypothetical protein